MVPSTATSMLQPTSMAEKVGAEQNVIVNGDRGLQKLQGPCVIGLVVCTERSEWKPGASLGIGK